MKKVIFQKKNLQHLKKNIYEGGGEDYRDLSGWTTKKTLIFVCVFSKDMSL